MAGPQCCVPAPPSEHACTGSEGSFGPYPAYTVGPSSPRAAVLLISDIFGFKTPLLRKLADKFAAAGYFAVVPDYLNNDPFVPDSGPNPLGSLGDWVKKHQPGDSVEGSKEVIEVLNRKGIPLVGAVGFCWGAKVAVLLAKGHQLKAVVLAHPSFVTEEDVQDVKTPIAILAAEIDKSTPPALAEKFAEILKSKPEVESFVHIYPGVAHGWTVRYDVNDEKAVDRATEAHNKMLEWFPKFLK